jgi:hypothetical protein
VTNRIALSTQPTHLFVLVLNSPWCFVLTDERSLNELPDQVFVALGRRGMEPLPLKECTYECDGDEIILLSVSQDKDNPSEKGVDEITVDWLVECTKCNRPFTIRCINRYADGQKIDTRVDILDDTGKNLGWLGSY